ncbi:MAG: glycosyltransferase family 4 protein [Actinomycetia bacterium]|nr:glycosyltransferase family 4 protein [Actinomycetes bacterium]MCP5030892.1 glycosyltransferase family 4 protein [Actinomycetes bacterium]
MSSHTPPDPVVDEGPLRLAYLSYRSKPTVGGQGIYTRHLTKALADLGHHVEVFSGQPYPVLDERVRLHELPSLDIFNDYHPGRFPAYWEIKSIADLVEIGQYSLGTFSEPLAFSVRAYQTLRNRVADFDIVHDNQCLGYGVLAIDRILPTLVTLHHPITVDQRLELAAAPTWRKRRSTRRWYNFVKMQGRVARRMPRIVVVSENSIDDIHQDMGVDRDRMRLVHVGVDPDLFCPMPEVTRIPGRLITTASADVELKGLRFLLEAMAKLRTEQDVSLTVIGRAKKGGKSAELIERLGLADSVEFVTGVPDERIVELYAQSELAVVPSLYEGFSLPAVEAMGTATPLVATTGGALPEVTGVDGETVLRCEPGNADSLTAALRRGLDDPELRARIGAAGRERVSRLYTWRQTAVNTVDQYRQVVARRRHEATAVKP